MDWNVPCHAQNLWIRLWIQSKCFEMRTLPITWQKTLAYIERMFRNEWGFHQIAQLIEMSTLCPLLSIQHFEQVHLSSNVSVIGAEHTWLQCSYLNELTSLCKCPLVSIDSVNAMACFLWGYWENHPLDVLRFSLHSSSSSKSRTMQLNISLPSKVILSPSVLRVAISIVKKVTLASKVILVVI